MTTVEGDILWAPSDELRRDAALTAFLAHASAATGRRFDDYGAAWRWSVDDPDAFWRSVVEFFDLPIRDVPARLLADPRMPGATWFPGATLNYAEAVFARRSPERPAMIAGSEREPMRVIGWDELETAVAAAATGLRRLGVGRGDRVAAIVPNIPEAVIGLLATASLGAIWSSCSPEFGTQSIVDRLVQIEPKVLIGVDGYVHAGRSFDRLGILEDVRRALPGLAGTVLLRELDPSAQLTGEDWIDWRWFMDGPAGALTFESVPFDHPLWILFSSGTTGLPKAIVHGHGGVVVEHAKAVGLQLDVRPGDRLLWYTTTGWMMWNYLVGALLVGGTPVLYDGVPPTRTWTSCGPSRRRRADPSRGERRVPDGLPQGRAGARREPRPVRPALHRVDRVAPAGRGLRVGLRRGRPACLAGVDQRRHRSRHRVRRRLAAAARARRGAAVPEPGRSGRGLRPRRPCARRRDRRARPHGADAVHARRASGTTPMGRAIARATSRCTRASGGMATGSG